MTLAQPRKSCHDPPAWGGPRTGTGPGRKDLPGESEAETRMLETPSYTESHSTDRRM